MKVARPKQPPGQDAPQAPARAPPPLSGAELTLARAAVLVNQLTVLRNEYAVLLQRLAASEVAAGRIHWDQGTAQIMEGARRVDQMLTEITLTGEQA